MLKGKNHCVVMESIFHHEGGSAKLVIRWSRDLTEGVLLLSWEHYGGHGVCFLLFVDPTFKSMAGCIVHT